MYARVKIPDGGQKKPATEKEKKKRAQEMRCVCSPNNKIYPYGQKKIHEENHTLDLRTWKRSASYRDKMKGRDWREKTRCYSGYSMGETESRIKQVRKRLLEVCWDQPRHGNPSKDKSVFILHPGVRPSHQWLTLHLPVLANADLRANLSCRDCRYPMNLPA